MDIKIITSQDDFMALKDRWMELERISETTFYDTFQYKSAWWESFRDEKGIKLFIICVYDGKRELIAIAPLVIQRRRIFRFIKYTELAFMGEGDYRNILINPRCNIYKVLNELLKVIEANTNLWDRVALTHIHHRSYLSKYIMSQVRFNKHFNYLIKCPALKLDQFSTMEDYNRVSICYCGNRHKNKLNRDVGYTFKVVEGDSVFDDIVTIHKEEQQYINKKNKTNKRYSLFEDEKKYNYIKKLYSNKNNAVTFLLEANNGDIIIYHTCYRHKNILHSWNLAFNHKYEKYNVGRVIIAEIIEYIIKTKYADILDFGTGGYPWKFEWTDDYLTEYQLEIASNSFRGKFLGWCMKLNKIRNIIKE